MADSPRREHDRGGLRAGGTRSLSVDSCHSADEKHADIWANRGHEDRVDQGLRGVASLAGIQSAVTSGVSSNSTDSHNHPVAPAPDAITNSKNHTDMAANLQAMNGSMLQTLQSVVLTADVFQFFIKTLPGIAPEKPSPCLTEFKPEARGESVCLWGEFLRRTTAVDRGIATRTRKSENTFATTSHLGEFLTTRVPSISDTKLLDCLRCVIQLRSSVGVATMLHRL